METGSNTQSQGTQAPSQQNTPQGGQATQQGNQQQSQGSDIKSLTKAADASPSASSSESFDVKVNGKVVKMSRQEVLDYASMSHAAHSKFDEASKLKKSVDGIIKTAKTNPIQALMDPALGLTKDQIRDAFESWYHKEYIEAESLTPDQRKVREYESKLKTYEDAEAEKLKQQKDAEETELTNKQRSYLQNQIIEAIDKSGLPKSKWIASRMAFYMRENLTKGWDAPLDLIIKQVKEERQSIMSDLTGNSEGDTLINLLGEDVVNKIRQYDLKRLREKRSQKSPEFSNSNSNSNTDAYGNGDRLSSRDVAKRLNDLRTGKKTF